MQCCAARVNCIGLQSVTMTVCSVVQQMAFHRSMNMNMTTSLVGNPDRDFAVEMLSHHQVSSCLILVLAAGIAGSMPRHALPTSKASSACVQSLASTTNAAAVRVHLSLLSSSRF